MLRNMTGVAVGDLGLKEWIPSLGPYPLTYEMGMGIACVTLRLLLQKGGYVRHLQWDSMRKSPCTMKT